MPKTISKKPRRKIHLKNDAVALSIPLWAGRAYLAFAILLLPWIIYLAFTLPTHHHTPNWDVIWTGFDIGLLLSLLGTGIAALRRSVYIVITATATGTLLLVDAWFDLISEQSHAGFAEAVLLAFAVEIPLSIISYYLAIHVLRQSARRPGR